MRFRSRFDCPAVHVIPFCLMAPNRVIDPASSCQRDRWPLDGLSVVEEFVVLVVAAVAAADL